VTSFLSPPPSREPEPRTFQIHHGTYNDGNCNVNCNVNCNISISTSIGTSIGTSISISIGTSISISIDNNSNRDDESLPTC